jgi:hypothetical protein
VTTALLFDGVFPYIYIYKVKKDGRKKEITNCVSVYVCGVEGFSGSVWYVEVEPGKRERPKQTE